RGGAVEGIRVVHALPRRIRLKVRGLKGNSAFARELESGLWSIPGVCRVEASPATGNVLVLYDEQAHWRDSIPSLAREIAGVAPHLDEHAVARELGASPEHSNGSSSFQPSDVTDLFKQADQTVRSATGGIDLKFLVPVALVLLGVRGFFVSDA